MTLPAVQTDNTAIALSPRDVVENATVQAKLLMDIVEKTHCYQVISGKKYLQVEAWETIGAFNRVHAATEWINPITRDGSTVGYDAKVNLVNFNDVIVGSAIMSCYFTENACRGKEGDAKDKACKSAAQTFATSKAYRMNYSYVAILAGYQPTPAEEMSGESTDDRPATDHQKEHWCEEHQTHWFKKGKMKNYAHPIKDSDEWCNEPETTPDAPQATEKPPKTPSHTSTPQTKQELMNWVYKKEHNCKATVDQVAGWITKPGTQTFYKKMEEVPDNPESISLAYDEIKEQQGWD